MITSTFADRLWWARHRAGLGATRLARAAGCSQSLISSLERNNAEQSKLAGKFAEVLGVDPIWLAHGLEERAPPEFSPTEARRGREAMGAGERPNVVRLKPPPAAVDPRWAAEALAQHPPLTGADKLQKELVAGFMDYARDAGPERTAMFLKTLAHVAELVAWQNEARAVDEGHDSGTD